MCWLFEPAFQQEVEGGVDDGFEGESAIWVVAAGDGGDGSEQHGYGGGLFDGAQGSVGYGIGDELAGIALLVAHEQRRGFVGGQEVQVADDHASGGAFDDNADAAVDEGPQPFERGGIGAGDVIAFCDLLLEHPAM